MNKIILLAILSFFTTALFAQQKTDVVKVTPVVAKVVPIVPTKELKKQLEKKFKRKKYKEVITIADTLLKRNKKDENALWKKIGSKIYLKMDKQAIADLKTVHKNKDTVASVIASIPYMFDLKSLKRSGAVYYKAAMAMAPKNGIPLLFYGFEFADAKEMDKALDYANKGYGLLNATYKQQFVDSYAEVLYLADKKEDAYKTLEEAISSGNQTVEVVRKYFAFFSKDKRYQDGINKADEFIQKDSVGTYFARRGMLYDEMGNSEKACEDAITMRDKFDAYDYWLKRFSCPQVMAPVAPNMQRTYIYEVIFQGKIYDFRVTNPVVDMASGISFKYKMTGDVGINGVVNISKEAIDTAHVQMNRFGNGDKNLTEETSVWLSNEVFNELKTKGESYINASIFSAQVFEVITEDDPYYAVTVDDETKYIKCIKIVSKSGDDSQELWINDDPKNPLILKMNLDFSIELKQIL
jgi:tetratricopeptide (TPR) repeat protein